MSSNFSIAVDLDLSLGGSEYLDSLQSRLIELKGTIDSIGTSMASSFARGFSSLSEQVSAATRELDTLSRPRTVSVTVVPSYVSGAGGRGGFLPPPPPGTVPPSGRDGRGGRFYDDSAFTGGMFRGGGGAVPPNGGGPLPPAGGSDSGGEGFMGGLSKIVFAGFALKELGHAIMGLSEKADKAEQEVTKLRLMGLNSTETQQSKDQGFDLQRNIMGASAAEVMAVQRKLMVPFGKENVNAGSITAMTSGFNALKRIGLREDPEEAFANLAKAVESMNNKGADGKFDPKMIELSVNRATRAMIAAGGDVTTATYQHVQQTLAPVLKNSNLSEVQQDALVSTVAMQSGAEGGQQLSSLLQMIQGGGLANNAAFTGMVAQVNPSLIKASAMSVLGDQMGGRVTIKNDAVQFPEGTSPLQQLMVLSDVPRKFAEQKAQSRYNRPATQEEITRETFAVFGSQGAILNKFSNGLPASSKEREEAIRAVPQDLNKVYVDLASSVQNFQAKFESLAGSLVHFQFIIDSLNTLAAGMGKAAQFFEKNPAIGNLVSSALELGLMVIGTSILRLLGGKFLGIFAGAKGASAAIEAGVVGAAAASAKPRTGTGSVIGVGGGLSSFILGNIALMGGMSIANRLSGNGPTDKEGKPEKMGWGEIAVDVVTAGVALRGFVSILTKSSGWLAALAANPVAKAGTSALGAIGGIVGGGAVAGGALAAGVGATLALSGDTPSGPEFNKPKTEPGFLGEHGTLENWVKGLFGGAPVQPAPPAASPQETYGPPEPYGPPIPQDSRATPRNRPVVRSHRPVMGTFNTFTDGTPVSRDLQGSNRPIAQRDMFGPGVPPPPINPFTGRTVDGAINGAATTGPADPKKSYANLPDLNVRDIFAKSIRIEGETPGSSGSGGSGRGPGAPSETPTAGSPAANKIAIDSGDPVPGYDPTPRPEAPSSAGSPSAGSPAANQMAIDAGDPIPGYDPTPRPGTPSAGAPSASASPASPTSASPSASLSPASASRSLPGLHAGHRLGGPLRGQTLPAAPMLPTEMGGPMRGRNAAQSAPISPAAAGADGSLVARMGLKPQQYDAFRNSIAKIESRGRYDIMGGSGGKYAGRYQMGPTEIAETAKRLGVSTPTRQQFLSNPSMQERFMENYTQSHDAYLMKNNPKYAAMSPEQRLQVLAYAHNQGAGGASKWLNTGQVGKDAFNTPGTAYSSAVGSALQNVATPPPALASNAPVPPGVSTQPIQATPVNNNNYTNQPNATSHQFHMNLQTMLDGDVLAHQMFSRVIDPSPAGMSGGSNFDLRQHPLPPGASIR